MTLTAALYDAESAYMQLLEQGATPEEARAILPLCLKTEIMVSCNLREWRHIFQLRVAETTGKAHPQMKELLEPVLKQFCKMYPGVFDDILEIVIEKENGNEH